MRQSAETKSLPRFRTSAGRRTADLFDELHGPLLRYLYSLTGSSPDSEDLLQEAFLRLFHELDSGRQIAEPRAWLFAVAHNLAMDQHRRIRQRAAETLAEDPEDDRPGVESDLLEKERSRWLREALASLSGQQRQCLEMRAEGLRYREIAAVLGVQTSTVRTFIVRALTRLSGGPK